MKLITNVNDLLALLLLVVIIPGLWIAQGRGVVTMPGEIIGTTIAGWMLVLQFYFRKKKEENSTGTPKGVE